MAPMGLALRDHHAGRLQHELILDREDGDSGSIDVAGFFSAEPKWPEEETVINLAGGSVLDVGAGAGRHSLILQNRGLAVTAIDICDDAVTVMRERGVNDARTTGLLNVSTGSFDTVLMLGHGLGIAGTLSDLGVWLRHLAGIVPKGDQILTDSLDVTCTETPVHLAYQRQLEDSGRYRGETRFRLHYGEARGAEFDWLYADYSSLVELAGGNSWQAELIAEDDGGTYWARLIRR